MRVLPIAGFRRVVAGTVMPHVHTCHDLQTVNEIWTSEETGKRKMQGNSPDRPSTRRAHPPYSASIRSAYAVITACRLTFRDGVSSPFSSLNSPSTSAKPRIDSARETASLA